MADEALLIEAAGWHERLGTPDAATRAAFEAWRAADPARVVAYARVSAAQVEAQALAAEAPLLALRQQTLARTMLARRRSPRPGHVAAALALLASAPLAALGVHYWPAPAVPAPTIGGTWHTGIGQQAEVALPDGSAVTLDTASRIEIRYSAGERRVLLVGQGWFRPRPGAAPFTVEAGGRSFAAAGGAFDIRADPEEVRAFAAEGALTLTDGASSVALPTGRLLSVRGSDVLIDRPGDPAALTGWRQGLIQFDDLPLAFAVRELNRYRRRAISVVDPRAAALRISGTFRTAETPAFVQALVAGFPVQVMRDDAGGVVIGSR